MDNLTHIVLGAATGEILLGNKLGNKAMLLGAIAGNLPDIDMIYNFFSDDAIRNLEVHRSYSHSVFTHLLIALPLSWLSVKWEKVKIPFSHWYRFWFLGLFIHSLLDCCTTYGTQLLLPFTNYQVAFNNLSIIDPLYTLPFLIILSGCLFAQRNIALRKKFLWAAVTFSSIYILCTFIVKYDVHRKFKNSLVADNIHFDELNTTPTILNEILWSAIAYDDSMIYTSEYSYLKKNDSIRWIGYNRNLSLTKNYDSKSMQTITWFSDGNYFVQQTSPDTLSFYNIKWGRMRFDSTLPDSAFQFYWKFYKHNNEVKYIEVQPQLKISEAFNMLVKRIGI